MVKKEVKFNLSDFGALPYTVSANTLGFAKLNREIQSQIFYENFIP